MLSERILVKMAGKTHRDGADDAVLEAGYVDEQDMDTDHS